MTVAGELADFVSTTPFEDIPEMAVDYASMLVSSTMASAALGSQLTSSKIVRRLLTTRGGIPEASIWFSEAPLVPMASAARLNALMSDAAASDDSDLRNVTHPGTPIVAASVAVAEAIEASGEELLAAIALGYEVAARINTGVFPGLIMEKGFHGCMIGIFGAATATGVLLKLSPAELTHAIALSATSNAGLLAAADTSTAREHFAGLAAGLGVEAAQLAQLGYRSEETILEHPKGFFAAYGLDAHESGRVEKVTERFGQDWKILTEMAIKLVPGAHPYHAIAEAAANAAHLANVPPDDIVEIICSVPDIRRVEGYPRHPVDLITAAHSPFYFAAAGAADREFTWAHASQEKITDPRIGRLLDLVKIEELSGKDRGRYKHGASVVVRTQGGRDYQSTVYAPRGSAAVGIEWQDVHSKFRELCLLGGLSETNVGECARVLRKLRTVENIRDVIGLLRVAPDTSIQQAFERRSLPHKADAATNLYFLRVSKAEHLVTWIAWCSQP